MAFRILAWLIAYHRSAASMYSSSVLDPHTRQNVVLCDLGKGLVDCAMPRYTRIQAPTHYLTKPSRTCTNLRAPSWLVAQIEPDVGFSARSDVGVGLASKYSESRNHTN